MVITTLGTYSMRQVALSYENITWWNEVIVDETELNFLLLGIA